MSNKRIYNDINQINQINENIILSSPQYKIFEKYYNQLTCDKILLHDNHIYFTAIVNKETINTLILYISTILLNKNLFLPDKSIYLHISSKGGYLDNLLEFIKYKNTIDTEIISIIEDSCLDVGFLLGICCNYRIMKKNVNNILSKVYNNSNYWLTFIQCNNISGISNFYNKLHLLIKKYNNKISDDKIIKYFQQNNTWDAKKCKKIGFIDELV
jgi:ATP-dependent protease ClpP protease subunit